MSQNPTKSEYPKRSLRWRKVTSRASCASSFSRDAGAIVMDAFELSQSLSLYVGSSPWSSFSLTSRSTVDPYTPTTHAHHTPHIDFSPLFLLPLPPYMHSSSSIFLHPSHPQISCWQILYFTSNHILFNIPS